MSEENDLTRGINLNQYDGSKVLVTGGSGFIGSMLCDRLCRRGALVHAVSRRARPAAGLNLKWWQADLGDHEAVKNLFVSIKPDIVFHLASEVRASRDLKWVLPTFNANLSSTVGVLMAASENGCNRVVLAGSLEEPEGADQTTVPSSPYAAAKWAAGAYARMFYALYKTPVVSARLFMVYGPGQQDLQKLVPYVTLSLLRGESPKLTSGERLVDWVYVEDIVTGLLAMGIADGITGTTLDLGSGELVTCRRVAEILGNVVDAGIRLEFGTVPDRPLEQVRTADVEKTFQILGWKPAVSLQRGLVETVDWYRRQLDSGKI